MSGKKTIFIVVVALLLVVGVVAVLAFAFMRPAAPGTPGNPFANTVLPGSQSTGAQLQIRTVTGSLLSVPDFRKGHESYELPNGKYYAIYGPEYSPEGFRFTVTYSEPNSDFLITLIEEPIGAARLEAERYLRGMLMLTDEELCALNTAITVTPNVNEAYSQYENLGLSFCPRAVKLP
jgi:hypothetical protein